MVKNMYNPDSPEQYLVCICTGAMPGSGTTNRVSFLLVGESGSMQTVMPEGKFRFSVSVGVMFWSEENICLSVSVWLVPCSSQTEISISS